MTSVPRTCSLTPTEYASFRVSFKWEHQDDLSPNDPIGGLQAFLDSGEREVVVPIVDESEMKFGRFK